MESVGKGRVPGGPTSGSALHPSEYREHHQHRFHRVAPRFCKRLCLRRYVAGKFALLGLTECWRAELRPHNVRVMQINPSEVATEFAPRAGMATANSERKLRPSVIAHVVRSMLSMNDVGFITDASVWATNP